MQKAESREQKTEERSAADYHTGTMSHSGTMCFAMASKQPCSASHLAEPAAPQEYCANGSFPFGDDVLRKRRLG